MHLNGVRPAVALASFNPFGLQGSTHVSPGDDTEIYRQSEIDLCGAYADIDIVAEADTIPVEDNSQDYVISSHVFEHLPNPIKALKEWTRILKDGGIIFMIVPQRDALESDAVRPLTTWEQWETAYANDVTVDTWNDLYPDNQVHRRGHYFVYAPDTLVDLISRFDQAYGTDLKIPGLELVDREDKDTKVGNGFTLVYRVHKQQPDRGDHEGQQIRINVETLPPPTFLIETAPAPVISAVEAPKPAKKTRKKPAK